MSDLISRQAVIDTLNVGAELLRRVLDDTDIVGIECKKYEWGLNLIESYVVDMKELPSAQPEIIRCKDCKYSSPNRVYGCILDKFSYHDHDERMYSEDYCSRAERRDDER